MLAIFYSLLHVSLIFDITGVKADYNSYIIFYAGFSLSDIIMCLPRPAAAQPSIKFIDAPVPIPIVCTRLFFAFALTILMTPSVLETPPSVNKNTCLGYP